MAPSLRRRTHASTKDQQENEGEERESLLEAFQNNEDFEEEIPSLADIDRSMRSASIGTVIIWAGLVLFAYQSVPESSFEKLEGLERITALLAFLALSVSLTARVLPLVLQHTVPIMTGGSFLLDTPERKRQHVSGILIGGVTTQLIAIATNGILAFGRVPVLVDPVLYQRVSVLRWAEFASLAFLMTFLTEAFGVRGRHKMPLSPPFLHAVCQGLATLVGLLFPYCRSEKTWYTLLLIACSLYVVIFPRLSVKQRAFAQMKPGRTFDEALLYDCARLSLRMLWVCTICWTLFPLLFFTVGFILPQLVSSSSPLRDPAIPMVCEAILDVLSKLVQMNVISDVHNGVFDDQDGVRTLQRLEEVKDAIGEKWITASDVVIISVRQEFSGTVTAMVSPSTYLFPKGNTKMEECNIVFSLRYDNLTMNNMDLPTDYSVRPSTNGNNVDLLRLAPLAGLLVRAWNAEAHSTLSHTVEKLSCNAEITRLQENLLVVVVKGL